MRTILESIVAAIWSDQLTYYSLTARRMILNGRFFVVKCNVNQAATDITNWADKDSSLSGIASHDH